ncbi:peptidase domain-containing ABC transporter [Staphylococcus pseudintermedius]|uniref:peptidase domain-containing ABC transporter n=1 Tax=Staphylococcus pseudintermedius TaxID=283734 RepID=UPI001A1B6FE3|nr:peptidase domain-containing ABC transporter [Staphylococcus pseudintermedius]MBJ8269002.1 peptidase domain-containing ABC transporter [Staphylococcus pseudintermedius]
MKLVEQSEHSECGIACITMILSYYKSSIVLSDIRDKFGVPKSGHSLANLKEILNHYGLNSKGFRVENIDGLKEIKNPVICHWNNSHFVVLKKVKKNKYYIFDPSLGKRKLSQTEFLEGFSNTILFIEDKNSNFGARKTRNSTPKKYILNNQLYLIIGILLFSFIMQGIGLVVPLATQFLIDNSEVINYIGIYKVVLILILVSVLYYSTYISRDYLTLRFQVNTEKNILSNFIEKIFQLPLSFFINRSTGDLIFRANLSTQIQNLLNRQLITSILDILFLSLYVVLLIHYSLKLFFISFIFLLLMVIISIWHSKKFRNYTNTEMTIESNHQRQLIEIFEAIETIKSLDIDGLFQEKWNNIFNKKISIYKKRGKFSLFLLGINNTVIYILPIIILIFGLLEISEQKMSLGELIAFATILGYFIGPIQVLLNSYTQILLIISYFNKVHEIISLESKKQDSELVASPDFQRLTVKNLKFKYSFFEEEVLKNVDIDIKKGSKVAIVGESGAGKSTLLKVLSGIIEKTSGEILLNNQYIDSTELNKTISYVNQSPHIFNDSLYNNIFFRKDLKPEEIIDVIHKSALNDMISKYPLGLQTMVSENGSNFSGGQKQRISFARALSSGKKVFILDEPTSSLDNNTENIIMNTLKNTDITCIVSAHRLDTIKHFDTILVIHNGCIVEKGTHDSLMKLQGHYYKLYKNR